MGRWKRRRGGGRRGLRDSGMLVVGGEKQTEGKLRAHHFDELTSTHLDSSSHPKPQQALFSSPTTHLHPLTMSSITIQKACLEGSFPQSSFLVRTKLTSLPPSLPSFAGQPGLARSLLNANPEAINSIDAVGTPSLHLEQQMLTLLCASSFRRTAVHLSTWLPQPLLSRSWNSFSRTLLHQISTFVMRVGVLLLS